MKTMLVVLIVVSIALSGTGYIFTLNRAEAVTLLMDYAFSQKPELRNTQPDKSFTDLGGLTEKQKNSVEIAHALGITAGTSATTFGPYEVAPLWQWSILYGKTIMTIKK